MRFQEFFYAQQRLDFEKVHEKAETNADDSSFRVCAAMFMHSMKKESQE